MLERMVVPASLRPRVLRPASPRTADQSARAPAVPLADPGTFPALDPQRSPWPGREITSGGVTLHVRETPGPDGCRAVYVHGLSGSATNWTDLAALLGTRAAGTAVDLPGFGGRARPPVSDFSPAGHADALLCFLAGRDAPGAPAGQLPRRRDRAQRRSPPSRARAHAHAGLAGDARPPPGPATGVGPAAAAGPGARPDRGTRAGRARRDAGARTGPSRWSGLCFGDPIARARAPARRGRRGDRRRAAGRSGRGRR